MVPMRPEVYVFDMREATTIMRHSIEVLQDDEGREGAEVLVSNHSLGFVQGSGG